MGPRVQVDPAEFVRLVKQEKGLVIMGKPVWLQGRTYVARCGDYYYYTMCKEPLPLPEECQVQEANNILL